MTHEEGRAYAVLSQAVVVRSVRPTMYCRRCVPRVWGEIDNSLTPYHIHSVSTDIYGRAPSNCRWCQASIDIHYETPPLRTTP